MELVVAACLLLLVATAIVYGVRAARHHAEEANQVKVRSSRR